MQGLEHGPTHEATITSLPNKCNCKSKSSAPLCVGSAWNEREGRLDGNHRYSPQGLNLKNGLVCLGMVASHRYPLQQQQIFFSKQNLVFLNYVCRMEVQDASRRGTQPLVVLVTTKIPKLLQWGLKGCR